MILVDILNGESLESGEFRSSPSQLGSMKPATVAGFGFLKRNGDKTGTMKYVDYKPAQIYRGTKWFVYFSFRNPQGKFTRFKVYEDINRIKDQAEKVNHANDLVKAIDLLLKQGFNPYEQELKIAVKNWTVGQGLNYFKQKLPDRGLRKRTVQSYESVLRMMNEHFPLSLNIKELTKIQIQNILLQVKKKTSWSNSTYNNNVSIIRAIFNHLIDSDILEINPALRIKPLPETITRNRHFETEIFDKIKKNAPEDLLRFLMFLYHTGTRPNEARQLKYEHILRDRKLLLIPGSISKNKKDGYVPLSKYLLDNFKGEGFIFGTSVNHFTQKFLTLKKELKLPKDYNLYSIKATRAIHLAEDGADPYTIMQLFRHSGLDVTMSYLRGLGVSVVHSEKGIKF